MKAQYICHPDFREEKPVNVFHREVEAWSLPAEESRFLNRHLLFRRREQLPSCKKAVLRITADDYYKLYINGTFVTQGPAPGYPWAYYYNELDVTEFLREGINTFAVHVYYQGLVNRVWVSGDRRQMLWFSLLLDGREVLVSDGTWLCGEHTGYGECGRLGYDTAFAEVYDSGAPEEHFFAEEFDDSGWEKAAVYAHADYTLIKQPTGQLDIYEVTPDCVRKTESGLAADMGFEAAGYLHLRARGRRGDVILIRCGEELDEEGRVRYELRCNCRYEETWILSGAEDVLRQFDYKAFRYVELVIPETVEILDIRMRVRHYPFVQRGVYTVEDERLRRILKLCADTVKYGTQECFVDCPTREKGQYLGDVSIAGRAHAVLTGDTAMMKKAIREFCRSAVICPGIMAVSNAALMQEIADYSLQLPAQILWVYRMDHDMEFVRETIECMKGLYRYFLQYMDGDGLLDGVTDKWNLVDWPENLRDGYSFLLTRPVGPGRHNVLNAFWCGFLQALDELFTLAGLERTGLTERAKTSFIRTFYSPETGLYCDTPERDHTAAHSVILPLLFDIGTEDAARRRRMVEFIADKGLSVTGVYMAYFALAALVRHGERELAVRLAADERCWLRMLSEGATTAWEAWGRDQKWNTSLFHPWAAAPLVVFADGVEVY